MDTSGGNNMILPLLFIGILLSSPLRTLSANNELSTPLNVNCACPGENLVFNCTAVGSLGSTIWRVAAFDCTQNEIILRHSEFADVGGTSGLCNGGAISGRSIAVDGDCYTSQLRLPVSRELHNKAVTCLLNLNRAMTAVGNATIIVASELYSGAPLDVQLTNANADELTFSWNSVNSNCESARLSRNIMFDCGTCRTTSESTAVCTGLQIPSTCDFSIQNVVCGQVGSMSTPVTVTLKVPSKPNVRIVPIYSADTRTLMRFSASIEQEAVFNIASGTSGSVTIYNFSYTENNFTLVNNSCVDDECIYQVDIDPFLCSKSTEINVTISAVNRLGRGPSSNPTLIECMNNIVNIDYDPATSTIICRFMSSLNISKSCTITYGLCDQTMIFTSQKNSTLNSITLMVDSDYFECYSVTASSDEATIILEAQRQINTVTGSSDFPVVAVAVSVVVVAVAIVIIIAIVITVTVVVLRKRGIRKRESTKSFADEDPYGGHSVLVQIGTPKS